MHSKQTTEISQSHGLSEVAVYFNDSFPSHQNSWDPSMMGFDRWRMNCSINCESRFGTWEEMLRFLGRKDHGSGRGDVDPKSFTILNMDSLGPIIFRFHCWKSGDVFLMLLMGSGQVFVWELSTNKSGMSWESLEGFFFNLGDGQCPLYGHCPWLVVQTPGTLARSSRATGERARELRKGDREIKVREEDYKRLCHQPQIDKPANPCRGMCIFFYL